MSVSKRLRYEVLRRDNHACRYCGATAPGVKLVVDHVIPQALGGSDAPTNLVASCADCNAGKTSSMPNAMVVADVDQGTFRRAAALKDRMQALFVHLSMVWAWSWQRSSGSAPPEVDERDFADDMAELLDRGLSAHLDLTDIAFQTGRDLASDPCSYIPDQYLTAEERESRIPPSSEEAELGGVVYAAWWTGWERDRSDGRGGKCLGPSAKQDRTFARQLRKAITAGVPLGELRAAAHAAGADKSPDLASYLHQHRVEGGAR